MNIAQFKDIHQFKINTHPLLLEKESENNLPLGILGELSNNPSRYHHQETLLTVEENSQPHYLTMRTPPHLWILPSVSGVSREAIKVLADYLYKNGQDVPGVLGAAHIVNWFVEEWTKRTGRRAELHMKQAIYELEQVNKEKKGDGKLAVAKSSDLNWISEWFEQFYKEAQELSQVPYAKQTAKRLLDAQKVYVYQVNGKNVSMVCHSRSTINGATINGVFTPDQYKRKGYATSAVTQLSEKLLKEDKKFCSLYTDLSNPTSNSIYTKIGYKQVGESLVYHFLEG
ncbi:GNAT family N-acetyltransferase [Halobacillus sp. Marseille-Q1614]|uniref:GNAT family N-acetyltransferase n=1 Tax=Halobacillus sp. Marseille-Q1614 TaxID=2709134 RepID=UPI00156D69BF|nr:GNAT family N-acetyltransferase [Halobacillus sp. Marseille-Q1614]